MKTAHFLALHNCHVLCVMKMSFLLCSILLTNDQPYFRSKTNIILQFHNVKVLEQENTFNFNVVNLQDHKLFVNEPGKRLTILKHKQKKYYGQIEIYFAFIMRET